MVSTPGHLVGFFYMFFLLIQGSLMFTRLHVNKYWTFAQEALVGVHGTMVAIVQGNGLWPMFAFGFAGIFVVTQMYGLGLSRRVRFILLGIYSATVAVVYNAAGWARVNEIFRIPVIEYALVFLIALLMAGILWMVGKFQILRSLTNAKREMAYARLRSDG